MDDSFQPLSYQSDSYNRHEAGAIISLPDLSDATSGKKKRKFSQSSEKSQKRKLNKNNIYVKRDNQLINIKEEDTGTFQITTTAKSTSNIKVAVRLRPLNSKEIEDGQFEIVQILDQKVSPAFH
jgi:hypothetical protein